MTGLEMEFINGLPWGELVAQFREGKIDLLQSVLLTPDNAQWGTSTEAYFSLPYAIVTAPRREPIRSPADLAGQVLAIPEGWSIVPIIRERFPDVTVIEVDGIADALRRVQNGEVAAAMDSEEILRYVEQHYFISGLQYHTGLDFGDGPVPDQLHMLLNADSAELLPLLNRAIGAITPRQRDQLQARWLDYDSGAGPSNNDSVPLEIMVTIAGNPEQQGRLVEASYRGEPQFLFVAPNGNSSTALTYAVLAPQARIVGPLMDRVLLSIYITAGFLLLLLPLSWAFASPIVRPIKQLALENDKVRDRRYDEVQRAPSRIREIDELSESMVEMVEAIRAHERAQRELMDSFIQLIAQAIDDKSPYTGGHCERVPELALMLAESATRSDLPAFRDFDLSDEERWREYRIAAWLHDCGKITTPEHVVDKGSKLETIYNRIHEVRMRFEVLWRDAEINYLRGLLDTPQDEPRLRQTLEQVRQQLQDDFRFVANCNVGGEFLDPDDQERLRSIAHITWQRHFDDRLGLSPVDELRLPDTPAPDLPATEQLLADKPEHLIERDRSTDYPPEFGIRMDVPHHLYNLGELYNLSISRGTLTAEDRFKINEHMISTIKMLESLPFPEELKNVPRYASTHHETMKGSGYPRKLPGEALSIPERLLAVADVFEALTASDRPYKKAKSVSVAIDILHKMVLDNHIDRDSFELFLREGVYRHYAERFLDPAQIDDVDVEKYLDAA
jgi:HD-GYP domain-containing protein (c-di-GMP phosphodiesterase class II)